jgi:hypothetical protein
MKQKSWGVMSPNGTLWHEAFYNKRRAMAYATRRNIGAEEYERLGNDSARWKLAYRRGYRLVRVTVSASEKP